MGQTVACGHIPLKMRLIDEVEEKNDPLPSGRFVRL